MQESANMSWWCCSAPFGQHDEECDRTQGVYHRTPIAYLASPYSDPNQDVRAQRFKMACWAAGMLIRQGVVVFSPISHSHPIALEMDHPTDWETWRAQDLAILGRCDHLFILKLEGWQDSVGVKAEIAEAGVLEIPMTYIDIPSLSRWEVQK